MDGLRFLFSFHGRVSRLGLWRANLIYTIYLLAVALVAAIIVIVQAPHGDRLRGRRRWWSRRISRSTSNGCTTGT